MSSLWATAREPAIPRGFSAAFLVRGILEHSRKARALEELEARIAEVLEKAQERGTARVRGRPSPNPERHRVAQEPPPAPAIQEEPEEAQGEPPPQRIRTSTDPPERQARVYEDDYGVSFKPGPDSDNVVKVEFRESDARAADAKRRLGLRAAAGGLSRTAP